MLHPCGLLPLCWRKLLPQDGGRIFLRSTVTSDRTTQCQDPQAHNLNLHRSKKLKFIILIVWSVTLLLYLDSEYISFILYFFFPFSLILSFLLFCAPSFFFPLFIQSFIYSSIYSYILSALLSSSHSFIHSFYPSFPPSFVRSFVCSLYFLPSFILIPSLFLGFFHLFLSFLHSFIYSVFLSFSRPFMRWMLLCRYIKGAWKYCKENKSSKTEPAAIRILGNRTGFIT
jgi:hypothetical protein